MNRFLSRGRVRGKMKAGSSESLITVVDPANVASEAYRTLRTSLLHARVDPPPKVIVATSPDIGDGKSTLCANLGVVLAQAGKNVLIVDCDFRRPRIRGIFGLDDGEGSPSKGLSDVLAGECSPQEAYRAPLPDLSLKVLSGDALPPDPTALLESQRLREFLAGAREEFDYVIIDSPPLGMVSDPLVVATQGDGVLLVADAQKTRKGDVRLAIRRLTAVGANVLGTVMNNVKGGKSTYY
jgi:capsular exopolysaccharide synthesis family protein